MSSTPQPPPPPPPPPSGGARTGRLVAGLLLLILGAAWLLEVLDIADVPWDLALPGGLILIGAMLLLNARSPSGQGGLIATGIVFTLVLALGFAVDFPIGGGVGERDEAPITEAELRAGFRLGIGQLTVDLTELPASEVPPRGAIRVRARVGIGQLVVIVPEGLAVRVEARAGVGNVRAFDVEGSGFDVERSVGPGPNATPALELVLSVGIGQVEVRRA